MRRAFAVGTLGIVLLLSGCVAKVGDKLGAEDEVCRADSDCRSDLICELGLCTAEGGNRPDPNPDPRPDANPDVVMQPCFTSDDCPDGQGCFSQDGERFCVFRCTSDVDCPGSTFCQGGACLPDDITDPDPVPPPDPNPEPFPDDLELLCEDVCAYFEECGVPVGGFDQCIDGCLSEVEDPDTLFCFLELDCDEFEGPEIERCFEQNPDPDPDPDDREIRRCLGVCEDIASCPDLNERCPSDIIEEIFFECTDLCEFDAGTRSQILAAEGLPCEVVTDLVIDGFGIRDFCE